MPGLIDKASCLQEELSKLQEEMDRLTAENQVVHASTTGISNLKARTGPIVCSLQKVKACTVKLDRDMKNSQETGAVSVSDGKTFTVKGWSFTEELWSVRVQRANLLADLDDMTALVEPRKNDIGKSLANVSTVVQKTYDDIVRAVRRIWESIL